VFLLFIGYGILCVVRHGMPIPRSKVSGKALVLGFFFGCVRKMMQSY